MNSLKLNCGNCGKEFEKCNGEYNRQIKIGRVNFFCCLSCSVSFQMKNKSLKEKEKYNSNPKFCKFCNKALPYEDRYIKAFCNQSCAASFNNKKRANKVKIKKQCNYCKIEFFITKASDPKKYCNSSCKSKELQHEISLSIENKTYTGKSNKQYKNYLISKYGHKCQMCSFTEWGGKPILLILDHIDGNSDNFELSNLQIICSNCDTLTPTYKGRNKGKGRFFRKQRYHEGKSF